MVKCFNTNNYKSYLPEATDPSIQSYYFCNSNIDNIFYRDIPATTDSITPFKIIKWNILTQEYDFSNQFYIDDERLPYSYIDHSIENAPSVEGDLFFPLYKFCVSNDNNLFITSPAYPSPTGSFGIDNPSLGWPYYDDLSNLYKVDQSGVVSSIRYPGDFCYTIEPFRNLDIVYNHITDTIFCLFSGIKIGLNYYSWSLWEIDTNLTSWNLIANADPVPYPNSSCNYYWNEIRRWEYTIDLVLTIDFYGKVWYQVREIHSPHPCNEYEDTAIFPQLPDIYVRLRTSYYDPLNQSVSNFESINTSTASTYGQTGDSGLSPTCKKDTIRRSFGSSPKIRQFLKNNSIENTTCIQNDEVIILNGYHKGIASRGNAYLGINKPAYVTLTFNPTAASNIYPSIIYFYKISVCGEKASPLRMKQRNDAYNSPRATYGPSAGGGLASLQYSHRKYPGNNTYLLDERECKC